MKKLINFFLIQFSFLLGLFFFSQISIAASCCGSNISAPNLITTFEKWRVAIGSSLTNRELIANSSRQVIRPNQEKQSLTNSYKLAYSIVPSQWQIFAAGGEKNSIATDSELGIAYRLQQDSPHDIYLWINSSLPTGLSAYDPVLDQQDITGSGVYTLIFGSLITRSFLNGDISASAQLGKGFPRKIGSIFITPQDQGNLNLAGGISNKAWRIGANLGFNWNSGNNIQYLNEKTKLASNQVFPAGLSLSYQAKVGIFALNYSDETLLGPALNSELNRSLGLSFISRIY